jgi:hypothetical protein
MNSFILAERKIKLKKIALLLLLLLSNNNLF